MCESFIKAGIGKEMAELCVHLAAMGERPLGNFFRHFFECLKVGTRIAVPPRVVGNNGNALAEEFDEFVGHWMDKSYTWFIYMIRP